MSKVLVAVSMVVAACNSSTASTDSPDGGIAVPDAQRLAIDASSVPQPDAGNAFDRRVEQVIQHMNVAMYECVERVWPSTAERFRSSQVLLVSKYNNVAFLWNDQSQGAQTSPVVTKLEVDALDQEWFSLFNFGTFQGVSTLGISLDTAAILDRGGWYSFTSVLAFHEGFHLFSGQHDWAPPSAAQSRSALYPLDWHPRYLRTMVKEELVAVVRGGTEEPEAAAFWQQRLLTEHAEEMSAIRPTDVFEGTAEYAQILMGALAELGCDASDEELTTLMLAHLDEFVEIGGDYDNSREPYDIGLLAGLALRANPPGWHSIVEQGNALVEVLLDGVASVQQPEDMTHLNASQTFIEGQNASWSSRVASLLQRMSSTDHYRLVIPSRWGTGSFSTDGFLRLRDEPNQPEVILDYVSTHLSSVQGTTITVSQTIMDNIANPCNIDAVFTRVATIPVDRVVEASGSYTGTGDVSFTGLSADLVMADGLGWLCPTEPAQTETARRPFQGFTMRNSLVVK